MITLEKIDMVVERTGVSFETARDALNLCDGDEIEAIIYIQSKEDEGSKGVKAGDVIATLKEYIRRGNVSRIIIEDNDEVMLNIPLTFGAIGMVLAPVVAIIGLGATVLNRITVKIADHEGKITNINKVTAETFEGIKKAGADVKDKMKSKKHNKEDGEVFEDGSEAEVEFEKDEDMCEWREDQGMQCDINTGESEADEEEVFEDGSEAEVEFEKDEDMCEWREDQGVECGVDKN